MGIDRFGPVSLGLPDPVVVDGEKEQQGEHAEFHPDLDQRIVGRSFRSVEPGEVDREVAQPVASRPGEHPVDSALPDGHPAVASLHVVDIFADRAEAGQLGIADDEAEEQRPTPHHSPQHDPFAPTRSLENEDQCHGAYPKQGTPGGGRDDADEQ